MKLVLIDPSDLVDLKYQVESEEEEETPAQLNFKVRKNWTQDLRWLPVRSKLDAIFFDRQDVDEASQNKLMVEFADSVMLQLPLIYDLAVESWSSNISFEQGGKVRDIESTKTDFMLLLGFASEHVFLRIALRQFATEALAVGREPLNQKKSSSAASRKKRAST